MADAHSKTLAPLAPPPTLRPTEQNLWGTGCSTPVATHRQGPFGTLLAFRETPRIGLVGFHRMSAGVTEWQTRDSRPQPLWLPRPPLEAHNTQATAGQNPGRFIW